MKRNIVYIFLISIFSYSANAQNELEFLQSIASKNKINSIYQADYILKGNSFVKTDSIKYNFNGNYLISKIDEITDNSGSEKMYCYNAFNKINKKEYNVSGVKFYELYEYENSNLKHLKKFDNRNKLVNKVKYVYDKNDNLVKIISDEKSYKVSNVYYNGNLIKSSITNNSNSKKEIEYAYNNKNQLLSEKIYETLKKSKNNKRYLKLRIDYLNNEKGNISEKEYYKSENITEKYIYTYDKNDNLNEWTKVDSQGKITFVSKLYYY